MNLILSIIMTFGLSAMAPLLYRWFRSMALALFVAVPIGIFTFYSWLAASVVPAGPIVAQYPWVSSLGLQLSIYVDGLSLLFLLLISGIGALVSLFSIGYLKRDQKMGRFFSFLLLFMGSMLGLVASGDIILLFVFWELTSISSFLLIGFNYENAQARRSAIQAFLVTGGAGLALMAGLILLGQIAGTFEIAQLLKRGDLVRASPLYVPCFVLIMVGVLAKSAQVPFHFWLPNAMSAPTPVSAYLHSATMVKAGVFLVARFFPVLGGTEIWFYTLTLFGSLTALAGPLFALEQTDLKRLLAYSTIGALGMIMLLFGIGSVTAVNAAIVFILVHSLYKGSLFMVAGTVDHQTGTRDVSGLLGLMRPMPLTAIAAVLSGLSMAGFPPLFGFIGKELIYEAKLETFGQNWIIFGIGVVSNMMTVAIAFTVGLEPFLGRKVVSPKVPREGSVALWLGPVLLGLGGLFIGIFPDRLEALLSIAADGVLGSPNHLILKPWHGFSLILFFSMLTFFGGIFILLWRKQLRAVFKPLAALGTYGPERIYESSLNFSISVATRLTRFVQSGVISQYILVTVVSAVILIFVVALDAVEPRSFLDQIERSWAGTHLEEIVAACFVFAGAAATTLGRSRVFALTGMGLVGFGLAFFFALFSAPDVAITQVLVESLSVTLTVFLFAWLPEKSFAAAPSRAARTIVVLGLGIALTSVSLFMGQSRQFGEPVSNYFRENALTQGHGKNIVNVILVDFRAIDTLGEITVIAAAGVGVLALLATRTRNQAEGPR